MRVLRTGVELRPGRDLPEAAVEAQVFVDVEIEGRRERWGGTVTASDEPLPDSGDPTSELLRRARDAMYHLADLYGEMRIEGADLTRWEFHASPHRIEIDDELRTRLTGRWKQRDPQPPGDD